MDSLPSVIKLLIVVSLISGSYQNIIKASEGDTVTFDCSGNGPVWFVAWVYKTEGNDKRDVIMACDDSDSEDEQVQACKNSTVCQDSSRCTVTTEIHVEKSTFTSTLTVENIASSFNKNIIECILGDADKYNTDEITIVESYTLNVCKHPDSVNCETTFDSDGVAEMSCTMNQVSSEFVCRIVPHDVASFESKTTLATGELGSNMPLQTASSDSMQCYDVRCSGKYYPEKSSNVHFRIEINSTRNKLGPVFSISMQTPKMDVSLNETIMEECRNKISDISKSFYLFLGGVVCFGATIFVIFSWLIWNRCRQSRHYSGATNNVDNVYQTIDDTRQNYLAESSLISSSDHSDGRLTCSTVVSDSQNEEDTLPHKLIEDSSNVTHSYPPRPHLTDKKCSMSNEYIVPKTPPSTLTSFYRNPNSLSPGSRGNAPKLPDMRNTDLLS